MEFKEIVESMRQLEEENRKFKAIKENYITYSKKLKEIAETLEDMAKEIDPVANVLKAEKSYVNFGPMFEDLLNIMKSGTRINFILIEKTYPNLNVPQIRYIIKHLKDISGVDSFKEGRNTYLWWKKKAE